MPLSPHAKEKLMGKQGLGRLTVPTRRHLLAGMASLNDALRPAAAGTGVAAGTAPLHPDAALIAAAAEFCALEERRVGLIEGPGRIDDDGDRDRALQPIAAAQEMYLRVLCDARATTPDGHRARASAIVLGDGAEVFYRAQVCGLPEDLLIAALLRDVVDLPC